MPKNSGKKGNNVVKEEKAIEAAPPIPMEEPNTTRIVLTWVAEIMQRPFFYVLLALVVLIVGAYYCLTLVPESDRLSAIGRMIDGGIDLIRLLLTTSGAVPVWIVVCGGVLAMWWIVSLKTTVRLQDERIAAMATEKAELHSALEKIVGKSVFQSSAMPNKVP